MSDEFIDLKIDDLHKRIQMIREKSNHMHNIASNRLDAMETSIKSHEYRITRVEKRNKDEKTKKVVTITWLERVIWFFVVVGFFIGGKLFL